MNGTAHVLTFSPSSHNHSDDKIFILEHVVCVQQPSRSNKFKGRNDIFVRRNYEIGSRSLFVFQMLFSFHIFDLNTV